ncbi:hypothetical protein FKW77_003942 [Venturia effusa]|uniref:DUF7580 domain-containing protein n=1 Tax=Venturia effusa TaxID=50376 RepID=A0A517L546_9PEZI|nr:hypothetical protein FKW77_003942 [Venturia effusa]
MTDPISLGLGVAGLVPVILETLKAFKTIREGIKVARKCDRELDQMERDLKIQRVRFRNECVLLLQQDGEDVRQKQEMVADPLHEKWTDASIEKQLRKTLRDSYEACQLIIERIRDAQRELICDLDSFGEVRRLKGKDESMGKAFRRINKSIQFAFNKSTFEKKIDQLRDRNRDLESLRSQVDQFQRPRGTVHQSNCIARKTIPGRFKDVRHISDEAYGALCASFSCANGAHDEHLASLLLDVSNGGDFHLEMSILSVMRCSPSFDDEPPLRLVLQPRPIASVNPLLSTPSASGWSTADAAEVQRHLNEVDRKMKRKREVMFEDEIAGPKKDANTTAPTISPSDRLMTIQDLCNTQSACDFLRQACGCTEQATDHQYVAFLQKPRFSKYVFYVSSGRHVAVEEVTILNTPNMSLYEFLMAEKEWTVTIVHQLKLALKLTLAVLRYHSTAWLDPQWRLSQLMLSMSSSKSPEDFSLYLNSKLAPSQPRNPGPVSELEGPEIQMTGSSELTSLKKCSLTEDQRHGNHNSTLFCLGLALLEIGHWKSLVELREDYDRDDYDTVWRLGYGTSALGQGYDDIVLQCLRCDFGAKTTDLNRHELQDAVYNDIVCPLEGLIEGLGKMAL